jgi:hypothetical protein
VQLQDLRARLKRLDKLVRGLALEVALLRKGDDPLLYRERRAYLKAVQEAQAGLELARVTLAGAVRQMQGPRRCPVSRCGLAPAVF